MRPSSMQRAEPVTHRGRYGALLIGLAAGQLVVARALASDDYWVWLVAAALGAAVISLGVALVGLVYGSVSGRRPGLANADARERTLLFVVSVLLLVSLGIGIWQAPQREQDLGWLIFPWALAALSVGIQWVTRPVGREPEAPATPAAPPRVEPPPPIGPVAA